MSGSSSSGPGPNCVVDVMGQNLPPALQKRLMEVAPPARCNPLTCTPVPGSVLPVQRLGGMTNAAARFHRGAGERDGVAARAQAHQPT
jgi:hypothetical protein